MVVPLEGREVELHLLMARVLLLKLVMCGLKLTISIQRAMILLLRGTGADGFGYFAALHEVGHAIRL